MNAPLKLGQSIARREDRRFLTGKGRYTDDTAPDAALAVLFVRSPHAHARIAGIDRDAALASPGVAAVYTAQDTAADGLGHLPAISEIKDADGNRHREPPHLPMPVGKVRHVGDIVAMIVAVFSARHARFGAPRRFAFGEEFAAAAVSERASGARLSIAANSAATVLREAAALADAEVCIDRSLTAASRRTTTASPSDLIASARMTGVMGAAMSARA